MNITVNGEITVCNEGATLLDLILRLGLSPEKIVVERNRDIVPAGTRFDLYQWQQAFEYAYKDIRDRGKTPILCGGTGLYIQAATCGYTLPQVPPNEELREELEQYDTEILIAKLSGYGPLPDQGVLQSKRRIIRALEVAMYEREHPVKRDGSTDREVTR